MIFGSSVLHPGINADISFISPVVRHFKVQGGFGNCGVFLAHNYVSEQFGNYVEYGMYTPGNGAAVPDFLDGVYIKFYYYYLLCTKTGIDFVQSDYYYYLFKPPLPKNKIQYNVQI